MKSSLQAKCENKGSENRLDCWDRIVCQREYKTQTTVRRCALKRWTLGKLSHY